MSRRRRYVLTALVAALLAVLVVAVVLSYGDPERRGNTYTTRFESHELNRATAFRFRMRVDTEEYNSHADLAPDNPSAFWAYGGARG